MALKFVGNVYPDRSQDLGFVCERNFYSLCVQCDIYRLHIYPTFQGVYYIVIKDFLF
jgi:hypothetical protein